MFDKMMAAEAAKRQAAAEARRNAEAALTPIIRTRRAIMLAAAGVHPQYGLDSRVEVGTTPVGIQGERITIDAETWGTRIHDAAQAWRVAPGFGVLLAGPLPDMLPANTGSGVWSAADLFWRASRQSAETPQVVAEVAATLKALPVATDGVRHVETSLGFWVFLRQLDRYFDDYAAARPPVRLPDLGALADVRAALIVARSGVADTPSEREALRRGLCALPNAAEYAGAYFGDPDAMQAAAEVLARWRAPASLAPPTPTVSSDPRRHLDRFDALAHQALGISVTSYGVAADPSAPAEAEPAASPASEPASTPTVAIEGDHRLADERAKILGELHEAAGSAGFLSLDSLREAAGSVLRRYNYASSATMIRDALKRDGVNARGRTFPAGPALEAIARHLTGVPARAKRTPKKPSPTGGTIARKRT